ncbi:Citrate synthase [Beutenbergia cavernae DSM 12333]|uniref:citrate synthase (unknown stereospecificity) n=1 Tax=Beutenbergia cavernae (strain ATCC BAA-8 / DSM 12333 / CCUG 43141 / JCM 11478 / NBRC 16432 / NCIMB 13614 / HKI 0122) TaxID=471853 RepID=C5C3T0_BEUC1|nr:citrate/2-methylcitrate synthase [Beutenbergia cavernae]ACQ81989.1 Citrate synthase [Beutenbergia cavernae DSM 12333]
MTQVDPALPLLTSGEAAARLGVRVETLYAYVSRGRVRRTRTPEGSFFDPLEIERVAASRRRPPPPSEGGTLAGTPLMVLETDVAAVVDGELLVRGVPLAELVASRFDDVAAWLWSDPGVSLAEDDDGAAAAARVGAAMPVSARLVQRLQAAVPAVAATDPTRGDLDPGAVARRAGVLLGALPAALPRIGEHPTEILSRRRRLPLADAQRSSREGFAARLWPRLTARPPEPGGVLALETALVALVDHDLAASTLAARAAASARADVDGVVLAGLGALDSALHGRASSPAHDLLARTLATGDVAGAVAASVRGVGRVPGFGHRLYRGADPRAVVLLDALRAWAGAAAGDGDGARQDDDAARVGDVVRAYDAVTAAVQRRAGLAPNVDLALGALTLAIGADPEAGEVVFALGRTVGWVAHALDEYTRPPLRLRPTGRYVGPMAGAVSHRAELSRRAE